MTPLVAGCVAALISGGVSFAAALRVPVTDDEAWFLQVVDRCRMGERLYRDVFYGAGPVAVWIALGAVRALRPQVLVLRAMTVGYFVLLLAAGSWLLVGLGAPTWCVVAVWVASMAFAGPSWGSDNHYGQLALLGTVVAVAALVHRAGGGPAILSVVAGAATGTAVTAKHNVGLVAGAGCVVVLLVWRAWSEEDIAGFALGVGAVAVASFWPVVRSGSSRHFVQRAFTNKSSYLATGRIGLREGARSIHLPFLAGGPLAVLTRAVVRATFVVAAIVPIALVYDAAVLLDAVPAGPNGERPAAASMVLGLVVLAATFPRADAVHVQALFPVGALVLTGAVLAGPAPPSGALSVAGAVVVACTSLALLLAVDTRHRIPFEPEQVDRDLPHMRGAPVTRGRSLSLAEREELRAQTGGVVFLLRPDAAMWYLAGDLRNPTPFDYPYASVFGPDGQRDTIAAIERGDVRFVCLPAPIEGTLAPVELQSFVLSSMEDIGETAAGTLYTRRVSG